MTIADGRSKNGVAIASIANGQARVGSQSAVDNEKSAI